MAAKKQNKGGNRNTYSSSYKRKGNAPSPQAEEKAEAAPAAKEAEPIGAATAETPAQAPATPAETQAPAAAAGPSKRPLHKGKTTAKAMGLKATLVFSDRLALASFADSQKPGESAHIEKLTDLSGGEIRSDPKLFDADVTRDKIRITERGEAKAPDKKRMRAELSNPGLGAGDGSRVGRDYIGAKETIEKEMFGRSFPDDSLRVQIAYNVLDIRKILGAYVNNIVYMFRNLLRGSEELETDENRLNDDLIGTMPYALSYDEQIKRGTTGYIDKANALLEKTSAYFSYFGDIFEPMPEERKPANPGKNKGKGKANADAQRKKEERQREHAKRHNYDVMRLLSFIRQCSAHGIDKNGGKSFEPAIYSLEGRLPKDLMDLLDSFYRDGVGAINESFAETSANNLYILGKIYPEIPKEELEAEYYDFAVRKSENNKGVSVKALREAIIDRYLPKIREDKEISTYRGKLYSVMDFMLCRVIDADGALRSGMISRLRENRDGEEGKEGIYRFYAGKAWEKISPLYETAAKTFASEAKNGFTGGKPKQGKKNDDKKNPGEGLKRDGWLSAENTDSLAKLLYFVCKFMDGKESNELLCGIMSKLDNIADLNEMGERCGETVRFAGDYASLNDCAKISADVRAVKNIYGMEFRGKKKKEQSGGEAGYSRAAYRDALQLLGWNVKAEDNEFVKTFFEAEKIGRDGKKKRNTQARNFILNNVLKSKRFFYVVKYTRPERCRQLMENEGMLRFVLTDLPDTQLSRYYKTVTGNDAWGDRERNIRELSRRLREFSVKDRLKEVLDYTDDENRGRDTAQVKEKLKALVGLYLTVCYLITKSMVKINTRFFIAFSVYERDYWLLTGEPMHMKEKGEENQGEWLRLTEDAVRATEKKAEAWARERQAALDGCADAAEARTVLKAYKKKWKELDAHYSLRMAGNIRNNLSEAATWRLAYSIRWFRNDAAHLNIVAHMHEYVAEANCTSYYALYCYIAQRLMAKRCAKFWGEHPEIPEKRIGEGRSLREYVAETEKRGTYSKDLMWVLNLPFAYNLPRYKNLSCEPLFYDRDEKKAAKVAEKQGA